MKIVSEHTHTRNITSAYDKIAEQIRDTLSLPQLRHQSRAVRLTVNVKDVEPLQWLQAQTELPRLFWSDRMSHHQTAAVGVANRLRESLIDSENLLNPEYPELRYYGGICFDAQESQRGIWSEFGASSFVIPRFELVKNQEGTNFACNLIPEYDFDNIDNILHQLEKLNPDIEQDITPLPQLLNRMDNPDQTEWRTKILQALEYLQIGDLQKIVLARKTELRFDDKLDPVSLLQHLEAPGCFRFLWEPQPGRAFVSIPPERLYKREERRISCEALAGTRPRGHTVDEDNRLGQELLNSDKERREHLFVADTIRKVLSMLCQKIGEGDAVTIMKLRELQHLMTSFDCELRETVSDSDVLANLHPTPAVAGYPVDEARNRIASMEPFDRGWYAGPVGWVNNEGAEFAVAIRSGLVYDNKLYLYSGAGIVDGSDWQLEWEEIENKITQFLRLFT